MIRYRPTRLRDIPEYARNVASHPTLGPRYGKDVDGARARVLGSGQAIFVLDKFLREATTPPSFWLGPEITGRVTCGNFPLLTEQQVAEANSRDGLNLLVLQTRFYPAHFKQPETMVVGATAVVESHILVNRRAI